MLENLPSKLNKMAKNLVLGLILARWTKIQTTILFFLFSFFFKNLALPVTRYHDELLSCTISEKSNEPIFRKCSDWWTHWWMEGLMDRQMDDSDLIRFSPTNVECQTKSNIFQTVLRGPHSLTKASGQSLKDIILQCF